MKHLTQKLFAGFLISSFLLSLLVFYQPVWAVDDAGDGGDSGSNWGSSQQEKTPWQEIYDKCGNGKWKGKAALCLSGYASAALLMASQGTTSAVDKAVQAFEKLINLSMEEIFFRLLQYVGDILGYIVTQEIELVAVLLSPDTFQYATAPGVQAGFYVSLQIANGLLAIGLVILANRFILGKESYGDLKNVTKYITTALLINFSLLFASYAVGISNFLTIMFLNLATLPETGSVGGAGVDYATRLMATMDQFAETFSGLTADRGDAAQDLIANLAVLVTVIILSAFLVIILAAMIGTLITRVVSLWVLMMVVPLAIAAETVFGNLNLPAVGGSLSGIFGKWQNEFIRWLAFAPIMAGVIWFTFLVLGNVSSFYATQPEPEVGTVMYVLSRSLNVIVALAILYKGFQFAQQSSAGVPKFVDNLVGGAKGWAYGKALPYPGKVLGKMGTRFGGWLADTPAGHWLQRSFASLPLFSRISHGLSNLVTKRDKLRSENIQREVGLYQRLYNQARTESERQAIIQRAKNIMSIPGLKAVASDEFGAMFKFLSDTDKAGLAEVIEQRVSGSKDPAKAIEGLIALGRSYGAELKADDVYKVNPMLKRDEKEIAKFVAREMSAKDIAKLSAERLGQALTAVINQKVSLTTGKLKELLEQVPQSSDKPDEVEQKMGTILNYVEKAVAESREMARSLGKDGSALWVLEQQKRELTQKAWENRHKSREQARGYLGEAKRVERLYNQLKSAASEKGDKGTKMGPGGTGARRESREVGGTVFTRDERGEFRSPGGLYYDRG